MTIDPYKLTVGTFINQLQALAGQLDKAVGHTGGGEALLETRLAPDMFPLAAQIKVSCGQATETLARLMGNNIGTTADVTSVEDARALIAETIEGLKSIDKTALAGAESRQIALDLPNGMAFDLSGADYILDWALPQFYFHTAMAYALIRQAGTPIGKADLVPHMMAHFRRPVSESSGG